jgi:hypothetical protein
MAGGDLVYRRNYVALLAAYVVLAGLVPLVAGIFFYGKAREAKKTTEAPWLLVVCLLPMLMAVSPLLQLVSGPAVKELRVQSVELVGRKERYGSVATGGGIYSAMLDDGVSQKAYKFDSSVAVLKAGDKVRATLLERRRILLGIEPIEPPKARPLVYRDDGPVGLGMFFGMSVVCLLPGIALWARAGSVEQSGRGNPLKYRGLGMLLLLFGMTLVCALGQLL